MKTFAALVIGVVISISGVSPATAGGRPMVGHHYKDVCKNIKGKQPIYEVVGFGPYDFNKHTKRKHDCVRVGKH